MSKSDICPDKLVSWLTRLSKRRHAPAQDKPCRVCPWLVQLHCRNLNLIIRIPNSRTGLLRCAATTATVFMVFPFHLSVETYLSCWMKKIHAPLYYLSTTYSLRRSFIISFIRLFIHIIYLLIYLLSYLLMLLFIYCFY